MESYLLQQLSQRVLLNETRSFPCTLEPLFWKLLLLVPNHWFIFLSPPLLRIMLETLYSYLLHKYGAKNHTFQICSHHLFASWASLFFFRHQVLVKAMISSIGLSANSLHSLVFLRSIYNSLLGRILSCWNYIYNIFLIRLIITTYTQSLSFSPTICPSCSY